MEIAVSILDDQKNNENEDEINTAFSFLSKKFRAGNKMNSSVAHCFSRILNKENRKSQKKIFIEKTLSEIIEASENKSDIPEFLQNDLTQFPTKPIKLGFCLIFGRI